ncbi:RNA polymerase, sigma-24 subunit, ECF subfamily [Candidatus Sulfopaludibacter sp. SbA3]|nr:RNA polymerase, sigma-24 subunit, ECF subfamily [Candidatus Sulfopaludibacter sp. SbA3]
MQDAFMELSEMTDLQLVEGARCGDQNAFGELIQRHGRKCVDLGCFFLRNRGDAEDQAQNAFIKAYLHLDQYQGEAEFSTWLARIVANECLMLMRVRRRARFVYLDEAPPEPRSLPIQLAASGEAPPEPRSLPIQLAASGPDPEGELGVIQLTQVLRSEMTRIPRLMRDVMLLRDIQGLPMRDVAGQLGITVSAAKSRLVRARAELRSRMTSHYHSVRGSSTLSRTAAPLSLVGRHCAVQVAVH